MHLELIILHPGVSAPARGQGTSPSRDRSLPAPHVHVGSKFGAQPCRTDHNRWFRLVGNPRFVAQPSRDRST